MKNVIIDVQILTVRMLMLLISQATKRKKVLRSSNVRKMSLVNILFQIGAFNSLTDLTYQGRLFVNINHSFNIIIPVTNST